MKNNIKKRVKIKDEFSVIIPNYKGVPCRNINSEHLRMEHNRWENEIKTIPAKSFSKLEYWQVISTCTML
jgi:hypothetical protein